MENNDMAIKQKFVSELYQVHGDDIVRLAIELAASNVKMQDGSTVQETLANVKTSLANFLTGEDNQNDVIDRLSELVAAIQQNKTTIESLTSGKLSYSDIVNDLTTGGTNKVLSAEQGKALKALIDAVHVFQNEAVLDKLSDVSGELYYDGAPVNKVYSAYYDGALTPQDAGFEAALKALGVADGGLISVVEADSE